MRLFSLCTFVSFQSMIWPSTRYRCRVQAYRTLKAFRHFLTADRKKTFQRIFSYNSGCKRKLWAIFLPRVHLWKKQTPGSRLKTQTSWFYCELFYWLPYCRSEMGFSWQCVDWFYFNPFGTGVYFVSDAPTATTFTTGTPNNAVVQGTSATLTCSANGYPAPVYTLKLGNTILVRTSVTGTYDISNVQLNTHDGQVYSCEPSNTEGNGPTQSLTLTVHGKF